MTTHNIVTLLMKTLTRYFFLIPFIWIAACAAPLNAPELDAPALTSTTFLADITRNIAGDRMTVDSLLPVGADPHSYQPTPQDMAKIERSQLIIINGMGYESFLNTLLENAGAEKMIVAASSQLTSVNSAEVDPHLWLDPNLVIGYVENIRVALTQYDPAGADIYKSNAAAYTKKLKELDAWIQNQVKQIPVDKRLLVTNHEALNYFAKRYGFEIVGAIVPSVSGNAAPSAQEMAQLIDQIKKLNAPAIFLDTADNDALARQIAAETKIIVVADLHLESLTANSTYIDMMKHNVTRIVDALK